MESRTPTQTGAILAQVEERIRAGQTPTEMFKGEPPMTRLLAKQKSECAFCFGGGMESQHYCVIETRETVRRAKRCRCRVEEERRRALALIPSEFGIPRLEEIQPDTRRHPQQTTKIAAIREKPDQSYFLFGDNGTGKTFLGWALYVHAVELGRKAVMTELDTLLKAYRRYQFRHDAKSGELVDDFRPVVLAEDLIPDPRRIFRRHTIFLDEISATTPTEYAAKEFFHLLKSAHEHGHQMIFTCNVSPRELQAHWSREDTFWGNSIARRIAEYSQMVNLFR
jgi:DNA replication protein DnaC